MINIHFDDNEIVITNEIRRIILDLASENDYSDSNAQDNNYNLFITFEK